VGLVQLEEAPAGTRVELCFCFAEVGVMEVPANDDSTTTPTTAATSTVTPRTLPMAASEYDGAA